MQHERGYTHFLEAHGATQAIRGPVPFASRSSYADRVIKRGRPEGVSQEHQVVRPACRLGGVERHVDGEGSAVRARSTGLECDGCSPRLAIHPAPQLTGCGACGGRDAVLCQAQALLTRPSVTGKAGRRIRSTMTTNHGVQRLRGGRSIYRLKGQSSPLVMLLLALSS